MNKQSRQQPFSAPAQRPAVAQQKRTPQAPPPYRPQAAPQCLQTKSALPPHAQHAKPATATFQAKAAAPQRPRLAHETLRADSPFGPSAGQMRPAPAVTLPCVAQRKAVGPASSPFQAPAAKHYAASRAGVVVQRSAYSVPVGSYDISPAAAALMTQPLERGEVKAATSRSAKSGVEERDVASYAMVQYLEKKGDGLTGDHQPSGAAIREALREALHLAKSGPLTRSQARNAYRKAVTVVVTDVWHRAESRTYGGRNSRAQIASDAADLITAAKKDFDKLAEYYKDDLGLSKSEIDAVWYELHNARLRFFKTGELQAGSLD